MFILCISSVLSASRSYEWFKLIPKSTIEDLSCDHADAKYRGLGHWATSVCLIHLFECLHHVLLGTLRP